MQVVRANTFVFFLMLGGKEYAALSMILAVRVQILLEIDFLVYGLRAMSLTAAGALCSNWQKKQEASLLSVWEMLLSWLVLPAPRAPTLHHWTPVPLPGF